MQIRTLKRTHKCILREDIASCTILVILIKNEDAVVIFSSLCFCSYSENYLLFNL